jgi:flagellar basal body-associated protein FliL
MELSLGKYTVPIPMLVNPAGKRPAQYNRFQFDFQLFALVSEQEKSQVEEAWKRHEGKIRDRVIQICRNASIEELQEPELAMLKAKLMDALSPQLGNDDVQRLLITEVVSQPI